MLRVEVFQVRQFRLVERQIGAGRDLPRHERAGRRHDDIVAGMAGEQFGFEHLVAVIDVVGDRDAGFLCEIRDRVGRDIVGPVVDVQPLFLGGGAERQQRGAANAAAETRRKVLRCMMRAHTAAPRRLVNDGRPGRFSAAPSMPFVAGEPAAAQSAIGARIWPAAVFGYVAGASDAKRAGADAFADCRRVGGSSLSRLPCRLRRRNTKRRRQRTRTRS